MRDERRDLQGHGRHRQHPAVGIEQPPHELQPVDRFGVKVPQRDDQQVAEGMPTERPVTGEAVLQNITPLMPPITIGAQGRQRHPQVAGGQHAELLAQTPTGAAVVGHRDDGGDRLAHVTQRRQRGREPMPTAQRDNMWAAHSRPRSRCTTKVAKRSPASR